MSESPKIDFFVTWVDGNDPAWQSERSKYSEIKQDNSNLANRYRDWDLMRYWFRAVEKFAPWVNRVFFVTCGHYPQWLNTEHPKLRIVRHSDYIPAEYLPTFNSNVIELFLNRISDLSEHFVLFCDDYFLLRPVSETDFFRNGKPCESALLDAVTAPSPVDVYPHMILNNMGVINRHFNKKEVIRGNLSGFFSPRYGTDIIRNLLLAPMKYFSAFRDCHIGNSYLKSTFDKVWEAEPGPLTECASHRFRTKDDVTHSLMKGWQICEGNFYPRSTRFGHYFELGSDTDVFDAICRQKYSVICLNDCDSGIDFPAIQMKLVQSFESILPERCEYEREP